MRRRILGGEPMGVYILHLGVKSIAIEEQNLIMFFTLQSSNDLSDKFKHSMSIKSARELLPLVVLLLIAIRHAIFEVSNFVCFMVKLNIFLQICQRES
ncbi:unnamed protein product [Brassica rapa subsp. trilocularis]